MYHDPTMLTEEQRGALDVARGLASAGVPIFIARPATSEDKPHIQKVGFALPHKWQQTVADPRAVDIWVPGFALCAVMGHGLDLVDLDLHAGGTLPPDIPMPAVMGVAATPSGGLHSFVPSMGVGSRDALYPGVDVKGGMPDGTSRGFAFLAPTVKPSKVTGELGSYRWLQVPDAVRAISLANEAVVLDRSEPIALAVIAARAATPAARRPATEELSAEMRAWAEQKAPHSTAVADRSIRRKLEEVSGFDTAGTGFRRVLLSAAMTLGGYVGAGHLLEADAWQALGDAVTACWGSVDSEDELWIQQGLTDGAVRPFLVYDPAAQFEASPVSAAPHPSIQPNSFAPPVPPPTFYDAIGRGPFDPTADGTDQGLAEAVLGRTSPGLRAAADTGTWVAYSGHVWEEREDLSGWAVAQVARLMPLGEPSAPKDKAEWTAEHWQGARRALFMSSAGSGKVSRKIRDITRNNGHPSTLKLSELDTEPEVLWAGGTPWDLRASGEYPVPAQLDPRTPHLHTAGTVPAPIPTPAWDAFTAAVWPDPEIRAWALRVLSISLAGYPDAALPVLYGSERTGKTSLITLLVNALGTYAHAADPRLLAGAENTHASVIYALKGRRLSFIDEGPRRGHVATERLKQLTGGGALTGNAMRANPITFNPTHTLIMSTNDEPQISDAALRARMRVIPCEGDQDAVRAARGAITPAVWTAEAPGVLAAMMAQTSAWLAAPASALNSSAPAALVAFTHELAATQDPIAEWVEECTRPDEHGTKARELYRAFAAWHEGSAVHRRRPLATETRWGRRLNELGYPAMRRAVANFRGLVVSSGGGGDWVPSWPVVGPAAEVTGSGTVEPRPSKTENPSSDPVLSSVVESVGSTNTTTYTSNTSNYIHIEKTQGIPSETVHSAPTRPIQPLTSENTDGAGLVGPPSPEMPLTARCPECGDDAGLTKAARFRVHKNATGFKCEGSGKASGLTSSRTALAAAKKATERAEKIAAAAGPELGFPAAMRRGQYPRSVTLEQAAEILRETYARSGGKVSTDIETNAIPMGQPGHRVRMVQIGDLIEGVALDPDNAEHMDLARQYLDSVTEIQAHSITADLAPLSKIGVVDYNEAFSKGLDTAVLLKLADPAGTDNEAGLKEASPVVLGAHAVTPAADAARKALFSAMGVLEKIKPDTELERNGWAQVPMTCATMIAYGISDVLDCSALAAALPRPAPEVLEREHRIQRIVNQPAAFGMQLDAATVEAQLAEREPRAAALAAEVASHGIEKVSSPKQILDWYAERGVTLPPDPKTHKPSSAKECLEQVLAAPDADDLSKTMADLVLRWRSDDTLLKNMIRPWSRATRGGDGCTYPTIYTLGADTGRMSCVRPNLQQVSRAGGLRECLVARPGKLLIAADFSSVEVRVLAGLSQDTNLVGMLLAGLTCPRCQAHQTCVEHDLHARIAEIAYGMSWTKANRQNIKSVVFGRLYGGGPDTLARQTGLTVAMVKNIIAILDQLAPGARAWSEFVKEQIKNGNTQYPTYSGRVIHLDPAFPHKGPNYLVQGTARELLGDALIKWDQGPYAGGIILPVHDEIVAEVDEHDAPAALAHLVTCMETEFNGVPITVEPDEPMRAWASAA